MLLRIYIMLWRPHCRPKAASPMLLQGCHHLLHAPADTVNLAALQGCYQLFWLFLIVYGAPAHLPHYHVATECETMSHLHTDEYGGLLAINLRNVTTTPPYRNLDLCCSGAECYTNGGVYYRGQCSTSWGGALHAQSACMHSLHCLCCSTACGAAGRRVSLRTPHVWPTPR